MKNILRFTLLATVALAGCQSNPTHYEKLGLGELVTEVLALKTPYKNYPQESAAPLVLERFPLGSSRREIATALNEVYRKNRYATLPQDLHDETKMGIYVFHFKAGQNGSFSREGLNVTFVFDQNDRLKEIQCVASTSP